MKRNKYTLIIEKIDETVILELQYNRFVANRIYKYYCKNPNLMTKDVCAVFLVKNGSVIKQYYID